MGQKSCIWSRRRNILSIVARTSLVSLACSHDCRQNILYALLSHAIAMILVRVHRPYPRKTGVLSQLVVQIRQKAVFSARASYSTHTKQTTVW